MKTKKLWLSPRELAELQHVNQHRIYRRLLAGQIPGAERMGGRWVIKVGALEDWLHDGRKAAGDDEIHGHGKRIHK